MAGADDAAALSEDDRELLLYDVPVTLPLITGTSAIVGGIALAVGVSHRIVGLDVPYFLAIALVIGGVATYLIVGMWLVPASLVLAALVLFSAHQALLYLRGWALVLAVPYLILGAAGVVQGVVHAFPRTSRPPG